MFTKLIFSVTD